MFLVSPVWWFYLYWMPKFLKNNHGIDLEQMFWPLLAVYRDGRRGQHRRRRAFLMADPTRRDRQCRAQNGFPGVLPWARAGRVRGAR